MNVERRVKLLRDGADQAVRIPRELEDVVAFDVPADRAYATLRASLERRGSVIGSNDMLIAAHALAESATLVTGNEREFRRVDGLGVINWLEC